MFSRDLQTATRIGCSFLAGMILGGLIYLAARWLWGVLAGLLF